MEFLVPIVTVLLGLALLAGGGEALVRAATLVGGSVTHLAVLPRW